MRTTVDIDRALLDEALQRSGGASRKAVLEAALRLWIEAKASEELATLFGVSRGKASAGRRRRAR